MIWRLNHTEEITTDGGSEMKESGVVAEIREISKKKKKKSHKQLTSTFPKPRIQVHCTSP